MPDPVEVTELVGVDVRVIVDEPVPVSEPVFDELAPTVTEAVGVRDTVRERLVVELGVIEDVPVPDSVEVKELVGVDDRVIVVELVPESEPVLDELAPAVTDAVGEEDADRERLGVELGVIDDVAVFELVGVLVGVPLPVALGETLELSETLPVTLALAPKVTDGVAEFDREALRVDVDDGVSDEVPVPDAVPDPVLVCEGADGGVIVAVNVAIELVLKPGISVFARDALRIGASEAIRDGVPVNEAGTKVIVGDCEEVKEKASVEIADIAGGVDDRLCVAE